ncbi:MAG: oligoribonuclease [Nesterenkonia sp.]|uniref:oligoribonuclease n=1 Tax=Nesterenkonia marinintestina TaxID=2979865 RepID=UPI0021C15D34|nr:oligoribonuclease [Nesterenkonia sp. GX14115]MDO5493601.1 oligoribonuclease [Nesterenkonia sp.]
MVWIDCEMTGLDPDSDALIEVAVLVTDAELNILGEGVDVVIRPPQGALESMSSFVERMHRSSGLLEELDSGTEMADAEDRVLEYVRAWVPEAGSAPLAGNSVHADRAFLRRDMPKLTGHLHYRLIDVSTLKELARRWRPEALEGAPRKTGNHRAMGDIRDSIAELRHYRRALLRSD